MTELHRLESSNAWQHIGMKIIYDSNGKVGVHLKNTPNLRQAYGSMHGGFIASAIDAGIGAAVNEAIGKDNWATTVELKVNYLLPVGESDIYVYPEIVKKGRNLIVATAEVKNDENNVVAIGSATFMVKQGKGDK